jgi:signal transduction histidine kinase
LLDWLLWIDSTSVVRRLLNQGFQIVLLGLSLLGVCAAIVAAATERLTNGTMLIGLAALPFNALAFWLTRRGGVAGPVALMLVVAVSTAIAFVPESYADPPVVHLLFLLPALIGALFVVPWLGLVGALLQTATLTAALLLAGVTASTAGFFAAICTLDLTAMTVPMIVVASLFRQALERAEAMTSRLDSEVAERTRQLHRQIELRERDITAVVHDLQNRMTVVSAEIDELLLDLRVAGVPETTYTVPQRRLEAAIHAVGDLVGDLRTAAQLDNGALELRVDYVDLELLARRVADHLSVQAGQSSCSLSVIVRGEPPGIWGDLRKLERVLANLVGNAIKYSRHMPPERRNVLIIVDGRVKAKGVELLVEDSGPGLDPVALRLLGQPFTRLASARGTEGMGLGIYISRGIVERHGGRITFSSRGPNLGTTVTLWLPTGSPLAEPEQPDTSV